MLSSPSTHPPGMAALTIRYAAAGKSAPGTMTFASRDTLLSDVMVKLADTYRINVAESYLMSLDGKTLLKPNGTTACADTVGALIDLGIGTLARPVLLICRPSTRISNELAMSSTAPLSRVPTRNVVDCTLVEGIKTQLERDVEYMNECARIIVPDILRHPYVLVGRRLCERSRVLVSDAESTTLALKTKLHKLNRTHVSFARTIATLKATDVPSCLHLCLALTVPPKFRPVAYASLAEPMTLLTYFHEPDTNDAAFADTVAEWTPKALEQLVRHTNFADVFQTKVNELETVVSGFIKSHLDVMNDDHQALAALTDSDRIASLKATVDLAHTTCRKSLQVLADGDGADMEHLRGCVEANTLKIGEMQSACDAVARDFSTFKTLYSAVSAAAEMVLARTIDVLLKGDNLTQIMEGEHTLLDKLFFLQYIDKLPRDYTLCLIEMARRSFTSIDDADECQRRQKFVDRVLVPRLHKNHSQEEGLFYALRDLECDGLAQYQFDQRDLAQHMEHLYMLRDAAGPESNCAANIIESVAPLLDQLETVARESSNERASQWMLVSSHLSSLDGSTPVAPVDTPNDEAVEEENAETKEAVVSSAGPAPDDDDSSFDREDSRPDDGDNDNKEDGTESDASFDVVMAGESIVAELREEVARVTLELDEARIELETQHEREKTRQCVFEKLSNDLTDELDRLQSQQDCRDQRIAELQAEQKRLTAAADHANEMRLDTVEANRGLQNAKNALAAEVSTLKASLSKAATTEAAVPLLEDQLRQAKAENDTLANEVEASRLTVEDLRADIADATSQMRYGKEQLAATEVTLAGLQKTVSALEEQLAESKRRCNVEEDDKTIALRSLERTTLQAQQAAADYEKRIKEVRAEGVAALAKQQREHNTALEVERQTHAAAYTAMTAEADEARAQAQRANEQLRTLEASVDSISVQMQSLMELAGVAPTAVKEEVQGPARIEEAIQKTSNQVRMRFDVIPALQGRLHDLESQSLECGKGSVEDGTISVGEVEVNQRMVAFPASSQSEAWMIFTESTKGRYAFLHDDAVRLLELNRPKGNGKRPTRAFVHILHYEDRIASPEDAIKYGVKPRLKIRIATVSSSEGIC